MPNLESWLARSGLSLNGDAGRQRDEEMAAKNEPTSWRIGFDIGGTFTDFILEDRAAGTVRLHKRLTSAHDPAESALIGLDEMTSAAGISLGDVCEIIHGTTLVTNAIIERNGAKLGLITTEGFRDILEM